MLSIDTGDHKYSWTEPEPFLFQNWAASFIKAGYTPNEIDAILLTFIPIIVGLVEGGHGCFLPPRSMSASQMSISGSIERMPRDSTLLKVL